MKKFIRLISFLLVIFIMECSFISCDNEDITGNETESQSIVETDPIQDDSSLPRLDLGGDAFNILGRDHPNYVHLDNFEISYDELPEDIVGQAVYNRNQKLKNDYNFVVTQSLAAQTNETAKIAYESGDDLYDLVLYVPLRVQAHAQEGYLVNLKGLEYVNLEHESWSQYINDQLTIAGKLYYTTNDFLLLDKARAYYLFYNRGLAEDLNLGYFEDLVDNNTWTLETMTKLAREAARDVDNNGPTYTDYFGLGLQTNSQFTILARGAGFSITEMNNVGYPTLVGATDKILNILDATLELTTNKQVTWLNYGEVSAEHPETIFIQGRMLFLSAFTTFIEYNYKVQGSDVNFGILPHAKYDSDQEEYNSSPDVNCGSVLAIPYTVADEEIAGYCLEAITEASTDTSYIAYIDTKCKYQDAPDEDCARMMDLCFENQRYEIGAFLFSDEGELYPFLADNMQTTGKNFYKRLFDQYKKSSQDELDSLIENYSSQDN